MHIKHSVLAYYKKPKILAIIKFRVQIPLPSILRTLDKKKAPGNSFLNKERGVELILKFHYVSGIRVEALHMSFNSHNTVKHILFYSEAGRTQRGIMPKFTPETWWSQS